MDDFSLWCFLLDAQAGNVVWQVAFPLMFWLGVFGTLITINIWTKPKKRPLR